MPHMQGAIWTRLSGGRTNASWCVQPQQNEPPVVVKLYLGPALNPMFPNDPVAEAQLLTQLEGLEFAPKLLEHMQTKHGTCNVYSHIPGEIWQSGVSEVAELMEKIHRQQAPSGLRMVANGSVQVEAHTSAILSKCDLDSTHPFDELSPEKHVAPTENIVLLHGDIVPGNIIRNTMGLYLIDWQCPAVGDVCEDISNFLSPAMQLLYRGAPLQTCEVTEFWSAVGNCVLAERYKKLAPWYHRRMAAYCLWQSQNGKAEYELALQLELDYLQRSLRL